MKYGAILGLQEGLIHKSTIKNNYIKASYKSIYINASHNREFYFNENNLFLRDYVNHECVNLSFAFCSKCKSYFK